MTYTSVTVGSAQFKITGRMVTIYLQAQGTTGGTASGQIQFTPPVPFPVSRFMLSAFVEDGSSTPYICGFAWPINSVISVSRYDNVNYGLGSGHLIRVSGSYPV